jgi:16S rRNA (guanine966-N2)-methyltransferase
VTRIVGGQLGGRKMAVPSGRVVRPTSERVREALASALIARLGGMAGRTVLDLYAGSGAVGLELLSRGASAVTLVESDPAVLRVLRANVATLGVAGAAGATVVAKRAENVIAADAAVGDAFILVYDVVFLDPPYALDIDPVLAAAAPYASEVLVTERATRSPDPHWPQGFEEPLVRKYGDTCLWYGWRS